jgi:prepilin-type N-terminal cleavage/methylation domain-containing protein
MNRKLHRSLHRRPKGFTLIELMVAIVVSGIMLMGVFAFASIQRDTANLHARQVVVQQALEGAMFSMGEDLRLAGLGFSRTCSEIRVWSNGENRLINPGAVEADQLANVVLDGVTGEPYWVLRDGLQAHWRSANVGTIHGTLASSASPDAASDSFDVFRGDANVATGSGVFTIPSLAGVTTNNGATLSFASSALIENDQAMQLAAVRQLFAPGSFVLVVPVLGTTGFDPGQQSQCALLQVTGEVEAGPDSQNWLLPIGSDSQFNGNLEALLASDGVLMPGDAGEGGAGEDWSAAPLRVDLVPLGRARWARYEIDFTVPSRPMLVRSDIIGWREGDPVAAISNDYPGCTGGTCRMPTLYLPGADIEPPRIAIGPMVEDMQVAVGCDGWSPLSEGVGEDAGQRRPPDLGFEEKGPGAGPFANQANRKVDERDDIDDRGNDEWIGNAAQEGWAPDCVFWGTAERNAAAWAISGPTSESLDAPGFRVSPQVIRVTLLAKPDSLAGGSDSTTDAFFTEIVALEDRPTMESIVGNREYRTLTERFTPHNTHWRNPAIR